MMQRTIVMTLTNRRGRSEERVARVQKQREADRRLTRITFVEPGKWRNRAFLSHDYVRGRTADERWIYFPARRQVRSIPASQRGDSFLGTDFTYADIQSELKFDLADWNFEYEGRGAIDGRVQHRLSGTPKSPRIARELGYGSFTASIDEATWIPARIDFFDVRQKPLKTIEVPVIDRIDGIWTPREVLATNHQTGHSTRFEFRDVAYPVSLHADLFEPRSLERRLPGNSGD